MQNKKLKWKSDFEKSVIIENFVNRGWIKSQDKEEDTTVWNVYWATVWNVRNIFNPKNGFRLNDQQIINNFPNHYELTRKDYMVKNLKRFKREQDKEIYEQQGWNFEFLPTTYVFPGEYSLFVEEFIDVQIKHGFLNLQQEVKEKEYFYQEKFNNQRKSQEKQQQAI